MLQINNLTVEIDNKKILDNFNIDIKPNTIHVIMGPNGVGKSTLSKVIMGDKNYNILSGKIIFNNEEIGKENITFYYLYYLYCFGMLYYLLVYQNQYVDTVYHL